MNRAIAIAVTRDQSFRPAFESARNFFALLADLLYGTPDRVNITYALAIALALLGYSLTVTGTQMACAVG